MKEKIICPRCGKKETKLFIEKDGICLWCKLKEEKEEDKKRDSANAIKNGEGSSTEDAICPYCGTYQGDSWEFSDETEVDCDNCEKKFGLQKEYEVTYNTWKLEKTE